MNELDKRILAALALDARISVSTLARQLGIARTTAQTRIERLERRGIIAGYSLKLGQAAKLDRIKATVLLQIEPRSNAAVIARLRRMSTVEVAHTSSGRFDMVLLLACRNTAELDAALDEIGAITGVLSSESLIHLSTKFDRAI